MFWGCCGAPCGCGGNTGFLTGVWLFCMFPRFGLGILPEVLFIPGPGEGTLAGV